jgi:hypothetical protein
VFQFQRLTHSVDFSYQGNIFLNKFDVTRFRIIYNRNIHAHNTGRLEAKSGIGWNRKTENGWCAENARYSTLNESLF